MRRFPPSISPIKIEVSQSAIREFQNAAKAAFPKELLSYLLGHDLGHTITIDRIWIPEDQKSAPNWVSVPEHFDWEAANVAKEEDLQVIGDLHSHPFAHWERKIFSKIFKSQLSPDPSNADWEQRSGLRWITGICLVEQLDSGAIKSEVRLWGPLTPVEVSLS